jgi:carboxyl-terminal processing protease
MAPKQLFMGMLALAAASLAAGQDINPPQASPAGATPTPSLNFGTPGANDAAFDSKFSLMGGKPTSQQRDQAFYDPPTVAGIAAIQKNDFKEGIAQMTKALELQPDNPIARGFRALAYMKTGEYTLSQADFDKVLAEVPADKRSDFLFSVAQLHWAEKRFDLVADDMTEVIKADAGNTNAWEVRSEAFANLKDDARSIADASEEIRLAPEAPTGYFERGIVYADAKRYDEALADLSEAIVLDPSIPQGFISRSQILSKRGKDRAALADIQSALKLKPDNPEALNSKAWILATSPDISVRNGAEAVKAARKACELSEWKNEAILDTLGAAYAEAGDFGNAVKMQSKAVAVNKEPNEKDELQHHLDLYKAGKPYREDEMDPKVTAWETIRYETFDTVWRTVNDTYFDPTFGGIDWAAVRETYRRRLDDVHDLAQLRSLLIAMVGELRKTHFSVIPRESAVFNPSERVRIGSVGAALTSVSNLPAIGSVEKGSPAEAAGLKPGDVVTSVDGRDLGPIADSLGRSGFTATRVSSYMSGYVESQFTGAVGKAVNLKVRGADGKERPVTVTCAQTKGEWSEPIGYFPSMPIETSMTKGADGVDVIRFNIFVPPVMREIRKFMKTLNPADGLVIDLRGNSGGISLMAAGICGLLQDKELSLGSMRNRDGTVELNVYPSGHTLTGPVAILIDSRSASTSEMFAAGMRDIGRARIFGEQSPGAALPSLYRVLPSGDLFQYAVADFNTPRGVTLEGTGIVPDVTIAASSADLASGHDRVMDAAKAWVSGKLSERNGEKQ